MIGEFKFDFKAGETVFVPYNGRTSMNGPLYEDSFVEGVIGNQHAYFTSWADKIPTGTQVEIIPEKRHNVNPFWVGHSKDSKPIIFRSQEEVEAFIRNNG